MRPDKSNNCGIGGKRQPGTHPKGLRRGKPLAKISARRKKDDPVYKSVKSFLWSALCIKNGQPTGDSENVRVMCQCGCGNCITKASAEPHHVFGRAVTMPNGLKSYWAPTGIFFLTHECHLRETKSPEPRIFHPLPEAVELEVKIVGYLKSKHPLANRMKWSDETQAEAILWALGELDESETCGTCGVDLSEGEHLDEGVEQDF